MQKVAGRWFAVALATLVAGIGTAERAAHAGALQSPGCMAGGTAATILSVDETLDLHLADGRVVHLAGIDPPEPPASRRPDIAAWLLQAPVTVLALRPEPDRWGRTVALVFAPAASQDGTSVSVTEAMIDAGLATAEPDPALETCWPTYLGLEAAARQARAGLWADHEAVLDPADKAGLERRLGAWALVEGHVRSVHEGRSRTYVRFANDNDSGMSIAIDRSAARRLTRTLGAPDTWVGRQLLARGLLDDRWGLQIDVSSPQQVSLSGPERGRAAAFH
jgi:endonuclease YncB( thermonuclease family)